MFTAQYLLTSFFVVVLPGTGVLYTVATGLARGWRVSFAAAVGCTLGIVPHLAASTLGLTAIMHMGAAVFTALKLAGSVYLLYLAWQMWRDTGGLAIGGGPTDLNVAGVILRGIAINILNPKLTMFFLAFLPQFITAGAVSATKQLMVLSAVFMGMTLIVFCLYGLLASGVRRVFATMPRAVLWLQRTFALAFAGLAVELALTRR